MAPRPSHIVGQPLRRLGGLPCIALKRSIRTGVSAKYRGPLRIRRVSRLDIALVSSPSRPAPGFGGRIARRNYLASNVSISFAPQQLLPHRTGRSAVRVPLTARRRSVLTIERL
jgi:hypothetical protein